MWLGLDHVPDCHRIRDGLRTGYSSHPQFPEQYDQQRRYYQFDTITLSMHSLDDSSDSPRSVPENRRDEAAAGLRDIINDLL